MDTTNALPDCRVPTINALELDKQLATVLVVDIRNEQEVVSMGEFPNSIHIPFEELEQRYLEIPKGKKIVVIDYSGVEFSCAAAFLRHHGWNAVMGLQGGVKDWIRRGKPLQE